MGSTIPFTTLQTLADLGWHTVEERILLGLAHDLNGRAGTLPVLLEALSEPDPPDRRELLGYMAEETQRVGQAAHLLRTVARPPSGAEPFELARLLPDVLALHQRHRGIEHEPVRVESWGGGVALRCDPVVLTRVLLVLLGDAAWRSRAAGAGAIALGVTSGTDEVAISVTDPHPSADGGEHALIDPDGFDALAAVIDALGGRLETEQNALGRALIVRLPRLGGGD